MAVGLAPPGSKATTVAANVWDLAFETVSRARSDLSATFHRICFSRKSSELLPEWKVWPMPLPFPEMHARKARRHQVDGPRKLALNYLVLILNFIASGESPVSTEFIGLGSRLTRQQWAVVKRLRPLVDSWNAQPDVDAAAMGRSAAKVESIEFVLQELEEDVRATGAFEYGGPTRAACGGTEFCNSNGHPGIVAGKSAAALDHLAKEIEPARIFFHGRPTFDPLPFLDYENQQKFARPLDFAEQLSAEDPRVPKVNLRCSLKQRMALLEKLDSGGRLHLLPLHAVRRGFESGMFAIPKDELRDRLIMDSRPANACEASEKRWVKSLGSINQLQHLVLSEEDDLLMHSEDLREFYHAFIITGQRRQRNTLKARFRPSEVSHMQCFKTELLQEDWVVPVLDTMAMGDLNSVAFGQTSHLSVILRTNTLELGDFISLKGRPHRGRIHAGLLIDDFVLLEQVPKSRDKSQPSPGCKVIEKVREIYEEVGLPRHPGKAVEQAEVAEFWGAEVNGVEGRVRPNLKRTIPLVHVLFRLVKLGRSTVSLLEVLSGALVACFQFRRRFMAMLHEIYCAQRGRQRDDIVILSKQLKDELLCCAGLLVVTCFNLRLRPSKLLVATDASSTTRPWLQRLEKRRPRSCRDMGFRRAFGIDCCPLRRRGSANI